MSSLAPAILRTTPRQRVHTFACPAEKSGQEEFDFEYGEQFRRAHRVHFTQLSAKCWSATIPRGMPS